MDKNKEQQLLLEIVETWSPSQFPEYRGFRCANCQQYKNEAWYHWVNSGDYRLPIHICDDTCEPQFKKGTIKIDQSKREKVDRSSFGNEYKYSEKAVERFKLPELKPHAKVHVRHLESEIRKERAIKTEELKKLEKIEKEAQERIKSITERVIEQNILRQPVEKPEEKTTIREIKYVTPSPQAENHVARQIIHKSSEHAPAVHKAKQPEAEMKAKHEKEIKTAMHMPHKAKDKKFMHIAREEKEILQKLERLRKGYIG